MKNRVLLVFILLSAFSFGQRNNQDSQQYLIVSTKGHLKSKGVDLIIKYPTGWSLHDGERPHVLYNIKSPRKTIYSTLAVIDIFEAATEMELNQFKKLPREEIENLIVAGFPNQSKCLNHFLETGHEEVATPKCEIIRIENQISSLTSASVTNERAGTVMKSFIVNYQIPYESKIIAISFNFFHMNTESDEIAAVHITKQIINTLVINNLWLKK